MCARSLWFIVIACARLSQISAIGLLERLGRVPAPEGHPGVPNATLTWHTQWLDHFDFGETRTFQQRVFTYDRHWSGSPDAPILFYCGNEANVELYINSTGLMWENAASLSALLVFAEHRYYGETLPLGGESTKNASTLRWLTMEQALADYARIIYDLKTRLRVPGAPVVALGGSCECDTRVRRRRVPPACAARVCRSRQPVSRATCA